MQNWEKTQYAKLINKIIDTGQKRSSRAGNTYSIFGERLEVDLTQGLPILHGRKMFYTGVLGELAALLRGPKHVKDFEKFGCNYWKDWAAESGELEVDYGNAWLDFDGFNQLEDVINKLKNNPDDRRMIISGWRPNRLSELSLPCCHLLYQWYVRDGKHLDMIWYQRSVDTMIGLPSDIILGSVWNIIMAHQTGHTPGKVIFMLGDTHIYENHIGPTLDYMRQLKSYQGPSLVDYKIEGPVRCDNFEPDMLQLGEYKPLDKIKFDINV